MPDKMLSGFYNNVLLNLYKPRFFVGKYIYNMI